MRRRFRAFELHFMHPVKSRHAIRKAHAEIESGVLARIAQRIAAMPAAALGEAPARNDA